MSADPHFSDAAPPVQPAPPRKLPLFVKLLLAAAVGVAALLVALLITWLVENARGRSAWAKFQSEAAQRGEKLDVASLIPAPIPDDQNFAATPLLRALFPDAPGRAGAGRDPAGQGGDAHTLQDPFDAKSGAKPPGAGNWESATHLDLAAWQEYFEQHSRFNTVTDLRQSSNAPTAVLRALQALDPELNELAAAAQRPGTVFPLRYQDNFDMRLPHLAVLKGALTAVRLRAVARLHAGRAADALADVRLSFRVIEALEHEPLIISQLVRIAMTAIALYPVWEGLEQRRWNEPQLAELQQLLAKVSLLDGYGRCLRGETAFVLATLEQMRTGQLRSNPLDAGPLPTLFRRAPSGWIHQNQTRIGRFYFDRMLPVIDPTAHRAWVDRAEAAATAPELSGRNPYNFLLSLLVPAVVKTPQKFAHRQASLDLAIAACALERFHLQRQVYPEKLSDLPATLAQGLRHDVMSGEPLKYARTGDGRYVVYSVGWNGTDEGGAPAQRRNTAAVEIDQGDWAWCYTLP